MIKLTISSLIFIYCIFTVIITLIIWIVSLYKRAGRFEHKETDSVWKCSVCSNVYIDSKHEEISLCPLCGSYNKRKD